MPDILVQRDDIANKHAQQRNAALTPFNPKDITDPDVITRDEATIYFYNVGPMEHTEGRPPNHPRMYIKACPPDQEYVMARGSIAHPFRELREDQNGNQFLVPTSGYREATKMLSPMNPGLDQDWYDPNAFHHGLNLNRYGVFWSLNNPPQKEEIRAAKKRWEETCRQELKEMADIMARDGEEGCRARANRLSRAAADYFGQSYPWHRTDLVPRKTDAGKVDCGACGERINANAKICKECGAPTDPEKLEGWLASKFEAKRGPGRPSGS